MPKLLTQVHNIVLRLDTLRRLPSKVLVSAVKWFVKNFPLSGSDIIFMGLFLYSIELLIDTVFGDRLELLAPLLFWYQLYTIYLIVSGTVIYFIRRILSSHKTH